MPSGYDEMTNRAFEDYDGGTPEEGARRALLRQAMEKQDFKVNRLTPRSGGTSTIRIGNSTQS
jgi:D-alanyl-D-alanine dipeptidase